MGGPETRGLRPGALRFAPPGAGEDGGVQQQLPHAPHAHHQAEVAAALVPVDVNLKRGASSHSNTNAGEGKWRRLDPAMRVGVKRVALCGNPCSKTALHDAEKQPLLV